MNLIVWEILPLICWVEVVLVWCNCPFEGYQIAIGLEGEASIMEPDGFEFITEHGASRLCIPLR